MRVRWTTDAVEDLTSIAELIRADNPKAAQHVARTLYRGVAELRKFPNRGRIGLAVNTRELVFAPCPYVVVYETPKNKCWCFAFVAPLNTDGNNVTLTNNQFISFNTITGGGVITAGNDNFALFLRRAA